MIKIYIGSKELKRLIVKRSFDFKIPFRYICSEIGIDYSEFMKTYINSSSASNTLITEQQFEKMLSVLGISVRHQFVVDSKFDADAKRNELKKKWDITEKITAFQNSQYDKHDKEEGLTSDFE